LLGGNLAAENKAKFAKHLAQDITKGAISEILEMAERHDLELKSIMASLRDPFGETYVSREKCFRAEDSWELYRLHSCLYLVVPTCERLPVKEENALRRLRHQYEGWEIPANISRTLIVHHLAGGCIKMHLDHQHWEAIPLNRDALNLIFSEPISLDQAAEFLKGAIEPQTP